MNEYCETHGNYAPTTASGCPKCGPTSFAARAHKTVVIMKDSYVHGYRAALEEAIEACVERSASGGYIGMHSVRAAENIKALLKRMDEGKEEACAN